MKLTIMLPIDPTPQGRPRFTSRGGFSRAYMSPKDREYRDQLEFLLKHAYKASPVTYPVKVRIMFFVQKPKKSKYELPTFKMDIDNLQKHVLDAMNGIILEDDGQVIAVNAVKVFSTKGCILLTIEEFNESDLDLLVAEADRLLTGKALPSESAFFDHASDDAGPQGSPH